MTATDVSEKLDLEEASKSAPKWLMKSLPLSGVLDSDFGLRDVGQRREEAAGAVA